MQARLFSQDLQMSGSTTRDLTLHCDYGTGSDATGDGSVLLPYQTPIRAMQDVAYRIAHKVNIVLEGATPYAAGSFPRQIDNIIEGDGSLTFYGVGAPTVKAVHGGPHTVTGVALPGVVGENGQVITIGAGGLTAHEFQGHFLRILTGGHPGKAFRVADNTTTTITFFTIDTDRVEVGDTVEIIRPSIKVAVEELGVFYRSSAIVADYSYKTSRLAFSNLWFDASVSASVGNQFLFNSNAQLAEGLLLDFVILEAQDYGVSMGSMILNYHPSPDNSYQAASLKDIANEAGVIIMSAGGTAETTLFITGDAVMKDVAVTGRIEMDLRTSINFNGSAAALSAYRLENGRFNGIFVGTTIANPAFHCHDGDWSLNISVIGACSYAVDAGQHSRVDISEKATCDPVLTDKGAVRIGVMAHVTTNDDGAHFLGKTAGQEAYICVADAAVKAAAWPVAGTYVTDAKGGEFLRVA